MLGILIGNAYNLSTNPTQMPAVPLQIHLTDYLLVRFNNFLYTF